MHHKFFGILLFFLLVVIATTCKQREIVATVGFEAAEITIKEGQQFVEIPIQVTGTLPADASFEIGYSLSPSVDFQGQDIRIVSPGIATDNLMITARTGSSLEPIVISTGLDADIEENETITFFIKAVSGVRIVQPKVRVRLVDNSLGNGLVTEYLFNGNALDTAPGGKHATVVGAQLSEGKGGRPLTAFSFDGSARIMAPFNEAINFRKDDEFTVSVWAKADPIQNDMSGVINDILRAWIGDRQGYPFGISFLNASHETSPNTFLAVRYDGVDCGNGPMIISGAVDFGFHHLVLVRSHGRLFFYVDGDMVGEESDFTACPTNNTTNLFIGCRGQTLRCFTGTIDDIRIFNRALSEAEVEELRQL
jgi:hypothetical protein